MPCYYDTPDSKNQAEIENRCKVRMYFDVQGLMTDAQIEKCKEMKISAFPGFSYEEASECLCKLCSILEAEQLSEMDAYQWNIQWKHKTLLDWYISHIEDDKKTNGISISEDRLIELKNEKIKQDKRIEQRKLEIEEEDKNWEIERKITMEKSMEENERLYKEAQDKSKGNNNAGI